MRFIVTSVVRLILLFILAIGLTMLYFIVKDLLKDLRKGNS